MLCGMRDWPGYVCDMHAMLRPGGWAESGDFIEDILYTNKHCQPRDKWEWLRALRKEGVQKSLDLDCGSDIPGYMESAGFVDIQRWEYRVPLWKSVTEESGKQPEARLEYKVCKQCDSSVCVLFCEGGFGNQNCVMEKHSLIFARAYQRNTNSYTIFRT